MNINNQLPILAEIAWEVCNQVGGIYTVLRSKAPAAVDKWGQRYVLLGPYMRNNAMAEFEPTTDYENPIGKAVLNMRQAGYEVFYGNWLITGRPKVVLFSLQQIGGMLQKIRYDFWKAHQIPLPENSELVNGVVAFGYLVTEFLKRLVMQTDTQSQPILAHFHEWMAATPIPDIRRMNMPVKIVFTTHATQLGRYLCGGDTHFYQNLPLYNWQREAGRFGVEAAATIERMAALMCDAFTTVSDVTGRECLYFLGRKPDMITPNGLNIVRYEALHEFQVLHKEYKDKINQFVMGHFFHNYKFDLNETLYFFTSGRFEYVNKGYDLTLEALSRLNYLMQRYRVNKTVIMFIVTKQSYHTINPIALQSRALLEEIRQTCIAIQQQVGERMFYEVAAGSNQKLPALNDFIDEYWRLRLRRTVQAWKTEQLPIVVTHNLINDSGDPIIQFIRKSGMYNKPEDRVKIVYHPDFITSTSPLFGMDYTQFVRGCHLGIFPSYYEPWGYTPLESIASGVPAVTSDLAGFGDYVMKNIEDYANKGIYVVQRQNRRFDEAANDLAYKMFTFVQKSRRERIYQRNLAENVSAEFDWKNLYRYYERAYHTAIYRR
ncbi:glycogen synthase [Sphingobacteriales bacterium UPWRP_1]|nr:glycogen synthase [Sphingobacteriales bacterium TSM_CSS]PSJ75977.1 glycogen synthase [Sphingobacteriales bacterium UPWRP_1]